MADVWSAVCGRWVVPVRQWSPPLPARRDDAGRVRRVEEGLVLDAGAGGRAASDDPVMAPVSLPWSVAVARAAAASTDQAFPTAAFLSTAGIICLPKAAAASRHLTRVSPSSHLSLTRGAANLRSARSPRPRVPDVP